MCACCSMLMGVVRCGVVWCGVAGSVFYCKQAPPVGAATAFADMRAAYDSLSPSKQEELEQLEAICSLHHHDTKIYRLTNNDQLPAKPLLTEEQRSASPPTRHPLVLLHPETGRKALHGLTSSTWCGKPLFFFWGGGGGGGHQFCTTNDDLFTKTGSRRDKHRKPPCCSKIAGGKSRPASCR
eukprot:COSAG06_NODE_6520_length_2897_cov_1.261973_6_plen_182_part_00